MSGKSFKIKTFGRMLEHLGVQMYKKRNTAIAELVANAWDAGADDVHIQIPNVENYLPETSQIIIEDDGSGMDTNSVQEKYMVLGRNRRKEDSDEGTAVVVENVVEDVKRTRKVMGRKGIGKLAGFGIASQMIVQTWQNEITTEFAMNKESLKVEDNVVTDIPIPYETFEFIPEDARTKKPNGTRIILTDLKHTTPIDINSLRESLARRFSRIVRGQMNIYVNDELIDEPALSYKYIFPEDGGFSEKILSDGNKALYQWRLASTTIQQPEMRGFTIHVRGKTAQAPNFFFDVEGTATGQHGTKVLTGTIEADYLDESVEDKDDYISTDRQEIDWEAEIVQPLYNWGQELVRETLYTNNKLAADKFENDVLADDELRQRIERLGKPAETQIKKVLRILGQGAPDPERTLTLASALVRAYEYGHFHDSVSKIESIEDPEMLEKLLMHLHEWKVMEALATLEIIKGRLAVIDKFHQMVVNDAPETANRNFGDNMHDLLAGYPWILNPEWQVLDEEKTISKQLKEWHHDDIRDEDSRLRYDFIALSNNARLAVIELKRAGYALELDDLQKLEKYKDRLESATTRNVIMVMVYGGNANIKETTLTPWLEREDTLFMTWGEIHEKTKAYYEHYRAVLEGDIDSHHFHRKEKEVRTNREIIKSGVMRRTREQRAEGLGQQDADYEVPRVAVDG